jgi:hypothetical protein
MTKRLLIFSLTVLLATSLPLSVQATEMDMFITEQVEDISISVSGQTVLINGAQGQVLEVVSLTGRRIATYKIESPAQRIELNIPKGCYILKIDKVVRKVSIR